MIINCFLKTSSLLFVFTLWVSLLHICTEALFVALLLPDSALESLLSLRDRGGPWTISALSLTTSLAAAQAAGREHSHLEKMSHSLQLPFPQWENLSPSFTGTGAGKRRETFCAVYSHRCSLENLNWAFAKQEPSPGLCFSEAENRHLLWETDLKNASDTVLLKSFFSSLCMILKMPCQMDVSFTRYFFLRVMNEVTLIHFVLSDGEHEKILYLLHSSIE